MTALVITLPADAKVAQVLVRDEGAWTVDVRGRDGDVWVPLALTGGDFELRDENPRTEGVLCDIRNALADLALAVRVNNDHLADVIERALDR